MKHKCKNIIIIFMIIYIGIFSNISNAYIEPIKIAEEVNQEETSTELENEPVQVEAQSTGSDILGDIKDDALELGGKIKDTFFSIIDGAVDAVTTTASLVKGAISGLKKLTTNVLHNPYGTFMSIALDVVKTIFGDVSQFIANMIQTPSDHTFFHWGFLYSRKELEADADAEGNVNKYINIGDYEEGNGEEWQKVIDVKKRDENDERFSEDTEIPVIVGDIYNIAVGHISFLDVNFLTGNEYHEDGSPWMVLRDFAAGLGHIAIYISAAIMLVALVVYGIQIVRSSFTNPEEEAEYKDRLSSFATSIAMLIGSVLIMGLCIFGSETLFNNLENRENTELPIRVNVEGANYSFSTTVAGYIRYMAGLEDVDNYVEKGIYTFAYIAFAMLNLFTVICMIVRMLALWILSAVGPIISALKALNIDIGISYGQWVGLYVGLSLIQAILSLGYMFVLNYAIK